MNDKSNIQSTDELCMQLERRKGVPAVRCIRREEENNYWGQTWSVGTEVTDSIVYKQRQIDMAGFNVYHLSEDFVCLLE